MSSDVVLEMVFHLTPEARGLLEDCRDSRLEFWTFPEDCEERLTKIRERFVEVAR